MSHETEAQLTQERQLFAEIENKIHTILLLKISARAETTLALRATQLASMWLGKAKGALGIETPYTKSTDPNSKVIEARADYAPSKITDEWLKSGELAIVKSLRADLKILEKAVENDNQIHLDNNVYQLTVQNAYTNCCQATMWLGMVINAIGSIQPVMKGLKVKKVKKASNKKPVEEKVMPAVKKEKKKIVAEAKNNGDNTVKP